MTFALGILDSGSLESPAAPELPRSMSCHVIHEIPYHKYHKYEFGALCELEATAGQVSSRRRRSGGGSTAAATAAAA